MGVRADQVRRRPDVVRYFFLAEGHETIHVGTTLGALKYARDRHGLRTLYLADIVSGHVGRVTESLDEFMARWQCHYFEPEWDYFVEVLAPASPPAPPAPPTPALPQARPATPAVALGASELEAVVAAAVQAALKKLGHA